MALAGNQGTTQAADKAVAKTKKLKKKPVATGSRGDSGSGLDRPTPKPKPPGPPNFPKQIPVRPGAQTNRFTSKPTTQAQRTHVHKERIKRNIELAPGKAYVSLGKAVETQANKANAAQEAAKGLKGDLAKKYAKKHPEIFNAKTKGQLQSAGFSTDEGVKLTTNAFKDLLALGQTPVSTYHLAEPTVSAAAHGDFKKAGKEAVKAGKQVGQQYVDIAKHPVKSFEDHPVFTGLAFAGAEGAVGRVAGAAGRSGALGAAAKAAASTERVTKTVPGTGLKETTKYSPDVIRKGVQVANEKRKGANAAFKESRGGPEVVPRDRMSEKQIQKRVDERLAANEDIRRQNREHVIHEATKALKGHEHSATSLIAQGIVKPNRADLKAYIGHLEAQHPTLRPAEKHANKELRKELQKVVDNPKVDLAKAKAAGERYAKVVNPRSQALVEHGMLAEEQALRAKLIPYAVRHMDAKHDGEALVTAEGKPLSTKTILEHYQENHSGELPAFVTHRQRSRGNFNIRSEAAPSIGSGVRTGRSVQAGLLDPTHGALVENAARIQGLKDAADGFKGIVGEFAVKQKGQVHQFGSRKEALNVARDLRFDEHGNPLPGGHDMVPIRLAPFGGNKAQLDDLIHGTKGDEFYGSNSPVRESIQAALQGKEGDGPWALIPKAAQKRIQQHLNTMGSTTFEQGFQAGSGLFRKTVLSTSPTWLFGNVAEAGLRSTINRAGPLSYVRGRRVLHELAQTNPDLAQMVAHRVAGGGHFSTATRTQLFRSAEQFTDTSLEPVANAMAKAIRQPGARNVAAAWHAYTTHVFKFNSMLERHFQTAMFGRALKTEGYKAVEDAMKGLKNTEAQVRLGRMVDDAYGRYSKWSPSTRHVIATYTPFISWWFAAVKFVFHVLPRDHPVITSLLATSNLATQKWREENKITLPQLGIKNGFLAGSVPLKGGKHVNIARYTPFGALTNPGDVMTTVLPQLSTLTSAARGQNWKGQEYKTFKEGAKGTLGELAGAYIPGFQREQSAKKYGVAQSLNPYRPIAPGKKKSNAKPKTFDFKGTSTDSGFDWGGGKSSGGSFDWGG